jgi:hypothetical protein
MVIGADVERLPGDGAGLQATRVPAEFEVALDGGDTDTKAIGYLLLGQTGVDGLHDLAAEVGGIGFHAPVSPIPQPLCNTL